MDPELKIVEWQAPDHELPERAIDWYISVVVIGLSVTIAATFLNNPLFALFCVIATTSIIVHAAKKPEMLDFAIGQRGILIRHDFYPYTSLRSFWVEHDGKRSDVLIQTSRFFLPHIVIPIRGVNPEFIRNELQKHLQEKHAHKNLLDRAIEYMGF